MHLSTVLLFLVLLFSFILTITIDAYKKEFSSTSLLGYVLGLTVYFIILLDQECVHNGPCSLWGWIRFVFAVIIFTFIITLKLVEIRGLTKAKQSPK